LAILEPINTTTFTTRLGDLDGKGASADIKIGGMNKDKFIPNINMCKWDDEAFLNVNHTDTKVTNEKPTFINGKSSIMVGDTIHSYRVGDHNRLRYKITYSSRPLKDKIDFAVTHSKGLDFYFQDSLEDQFKYDPIGFKTLEDFLAHHFSLRMLNIRMLFILVNQTINIKQESFVIYIIGFVLILLGIGNTPKGCYIHL